jgi:hypothetical protein
MKKIILTVAAVFALTFTNAQDFKSKRGENFMPEAGDWAISFQAAPFLNYTGKILGGNASSPDSKSPIPNSFVGKKFITDKTAYRVVANFGFGSNNLTDGDVDGDGAVDFATYKQATFDLNVGLGKEWRRGSTRLQGYYGADATVGFSSKKWTQTNEIVNFTYDAGTSINLGVNGFIGAEYFILPKMSIGAQYNYGLQIASNGAKEVSGGGVTTEINKSSSDINLGNVSSATMNLTLHF